MIQERYVVYEKRDGGDEWDEVSGHYTETKAAEVARKHSERRSCYTRVDWVKEEITRDGREVLDAQADVRGFRPGGVE